MGTYKMLYVAAALVVGWMGVAAICFANLATVPGNLAVISHQKPAKAVPVPPVPADPPVSVAAVK